MVIKDGYGFGERSHNEIMGIIAHKRVEKSINFPFPNAIMIVEHNVGDELPIHIHMGDWTYWRIRIHFTYDEFREVVEEMMKVGKL